ncbi:Hypothetical protein GbCGDNIH9_7191 [Granulibacter bethesdensis]|uniref:Uncharacterized protein n=1 Tax=Granulibacter bethesdensis TaxID=364410 RepID=A0AAC9KCP4_9PROT|nr:Hypothetical protein GbCGDNIH9_7191 [Granulibacter bethesdensis]APH61098.1 Hypothetical protein GbCGDNIH8_8401 [Granulibacter bethesdensis]
MDRGRSSLWGYGCAGSRQQRDLRPLRRDRLCAVHAGGRVAERSRPHGGCSPDRDRFPLRDFLSGCGADRHCAGTGRAQQHHAAAGSVCRDALCGHSAAGSGADRPEHAPPGGGG